MGHILAIDQGTTSSRALLFDPDRRVSSLSQQEFHQILPHSGWVEHDPDDIWQTTLLTCRQALETADTRNIAAIGITNQRETTLVWDRKTGQPLHNALVWQDRRTVETCRRIKEEGHEPLVTDRTGLLLDPYFSGTKIAWILDHVEGARDRAARGELAFGTIDSFLIWRLTGGRVHATDATNASRTLLFNIRDNCWDDDLCALLGVPMSVLPDIRDSATEFGTTDPTVFGATLPICGVAGDQQAATIGQACFQPGMMKSTYGTGCFALLNTGSEFVPSGHRLLNTIAYRLDGKTTYALEGSIFIAGAAVQWLRDGLGVIDDAAATQKLAEGADPEQTVTLVPAFTGLGAPWWDAEARGAVFGLTRNTGPAEFARAALESVGFQTRDLLDAMNRDRQITSDNPVLRVDGGMTASDWTMQFLADITGVPVDRPTMTETTALGAAWLAGHQAGVWPDQDAFAAAWSLDRRFEPAMERNDADARHSLWLDAIRRTRSGL
ncbi:MAG: glycerol kinase [Rhodospirillaceae bacterium]|nr:glycerol kinase [Rhodospirillaceae bacterium]|tara:strand:+ start:868 stop:2352 length:1485 start_codon:yes stop_codon:yes gene_type:complete